MDIRLSDAEKIFLIGGAEEGIRNDGRSYDEYRPIFLERGVLNTTDGSARVRIDKTDILVGVKCELQSCENSSKTSNKIRFSVDCSANASPQFEGRGGDQYAEDIVSALEAAYNNEYVLPDLKKLIVSPQHLWVIHVDIVILQYGGSIIDASSIGVIAALSDLEICTVKIRQGDAKRYLVDLPDDDDTWSLDISRLPLIISVNKIGSSNVVDCTETEEACIRSALWVATSSESVIPLVRQSSGGSLELLSIDEMTETAIKVAQELHKSVIKRLEEEKQETNVMPGYTFLIFILSKVLDTCLSYAPPSIKFAKNPAGTAVFSFSTMFWLIFTFYPLVQASHLQVVGNLAVVASHTGHVSYSNRDLNVHVGKLWCGVQNLGEDVTVAYGHFIRAKDGKEFEGTIDGKHVVLHVDKAPSTVAGKYKCEVRTDDGDVLNGNLFIYMAPVLHLPAGAREVTEIPHTRPPRILGAKISVGEGDYLKLECPVFGYPEPFVHWEKDGKALDGVEFHENDIIISSAKSSNAGSYKCTADNSFPVSHGKGPAIAHQLIYEQVVVVG